RLVGRAGRFVGRAGRLVGRGRRLVGLGGRFVGRRFERRTRAITGSGRAIARGTALAVPAGTTALGVNQRGAGQQEGGGEQIGEFHGLCSFSLFRGRPGDGCLGPFTHFNEET